MSQPEDWTEPGAFEVSPGVYRIPLPLPNDGLRAVNVYALIDGPDLVLVDGGWALERSQRQLEVALASIGRGLPEITRFLVTHVHRDHYTQAVAIRRQTGARVFLGSGEEPSLRALAAPGATPLATQLRLLATAGAGPLVTELLARVGDRRVDATDFELPDGWLDGASPVRLQGRELGVLPTPGHTRGHVVFTDRVAGLLFAGDHVLPRITPSIGFEVEPGELPLRDFLTSLRLVRRMPDLRLLPAHGPVGDSVHARVDQLLDHHGARLDACQAAVVAGAETGFDAARALPWTRRNRRFDELDPFNRMLATIETAAHLDLLAAQGRLTRLTVDGVHRYAQIG
ncbi:MAG TPA: MBL fold metallo-hydrolase [Mycobacteriales bacterium]|nr:MBL fold metallo-hydrolase [Mycobacteriales bacterium]